MQSSLSITGQGGRRVRECAGRKRGQLPTLTALRKITAGGSGGAPIRDPLLRKEGERSNHRGNSSYRGRERFLMAISPRNGQLGQVIGIEEHHVGEELLDGLGALIRVHLWKENELFLGPIESHSWLIG
jgi:hypothetical protein